MKKTNRANELRSTMNSPEYLEKLSRKDQTQAEVEELRQYSYVISTLEVKVSGTTTAAAETFTSVVDALPNDTVLTFYDDTNGTVEIHGTSINSESPLNFLKTLSDKELFSFIEDSIKPFDPIAGGYTEKSLIMAEMRYEFVFKCTLKGHYAVTWARFLDGPTLTPLTEVSTNSYNAGKDYLIQSVATYQTEGVNYTLTNIKINGAPVSAATLAEAIATNELKGKVATTMNIELVYTAPAEGEGGAS
jgi:hypothetical protein